MKVYIQFMFYIQKTLQNNKFFCECKDFELRSLGW